LLKDKMKKLFEIIKKNFKLILRSRSSIFIILIAPVLLIFISAISFNNSDYFSVKVGFFSENNTALTKSISDSLIKKKFIVNYYSTKDECVASVRKNIENACLAFKNSEQRSIEVFIDYSQYNLASFILSIISQDVSKKSGDISYDLTEQLIHKIEATNTIIQNDSLILEELLNLTLSINESNELAKNNMLKQDFAIPETKYDIINSFSADLSMRLNGLSNTLNQKLDSISLKVKRLDINQSKKEKIFKEISYAKVNLEIFKTQILNKSLNLSKAYENLNLAFKQIRQELNYDKNINEETIKKLLV